MLRPNREILPALRYTLEWIYQFVMLLDENHFLFRQCASAVIALLSTQNANHVFDERLALCFSKWFALASQHGNLEVSVLYHFESLLSRLICSRSRY